MSDEKKVRGEVVGLTEGARRATGGSPTTVAPIVPLGPHQRWSASRKRDVVLRLLRGESVEAVSREVGVEVYRLEKWRGKALNGIDNGLRGREGDPVKSELDAAMKRIGELTLEIELLRGRIGRPDPLGRKRSRK